MKNIPRILKECEMLIITTLIAVSFLESMGLPQPMLSATRADVEKGKLDFSSSLEYKMYSRHDKPNLLEG